MSQQTQAPKAPANLERRKAPSPESRPAPAAPTSLEALLYLQKFAGNAAVAEMVASATEKKQPEPPRQPDAAPPSTSSPNGAAPPSAPAGAAETIAETAAVVGVPFLGSIVGPIAGGIGSVLGAIVTPSSPGDARTATPEASSAATAGSKSSAVGAELDGAEANAGGGARGGASGAGGPGAAGPAADAGSKSAALAQTGGGAPVGASDVHGAVGASGVHGSGAAGPAGDAGSKSAALAQAGGGGPAGASGAGGPAEAGAAGAQAGTQTAAAAPPSPETDPHFQAVKARVHTSASQTKQHPPAAAKVGEAQAAAQGPSNEVKSQAGAAQVDKMSAQQAGGFDKAAFMAAVRKAIDAAAPQTLEEADDFKGSGKAAQAGQAVSALVGQNKDAASKDIKGATEAPPDTSAAQPKPVTPMPAEAPGAPPPAVGAASAMPQPKTAEDVSLAKGPAEINDSMQQNQVTEQQLKDSNEPEFQGALDAKSQAEQHSQQAPQAFQKEEKAILDKAKASASGDASKGLEAMHASRAKGLAAVMGGKTSAKAQDEARRAEVSTKIEGLYNTTKDEVTVILNGIDPKVDTTFKEGEEKARAAFESYVDTRMNAYKDDRYSGWTGGLKWAKDKLFGMPDAVNQFYVAGRELYLQRMEGVISAVADIVGAELTRAKNRIAQGQLQIQQYVASLPADLKKVGEEAQQSIQSKFDELTQAVDSKQEDLVSDLAKKYVASRDAVDARIKEMKDANKGLVDKAKDAVIGVINTIRHLKDMLLNVLSKAASVIGTIITAPIKFLGNLVSGIKQGLTGFMSNIGEHLKKGLLKWLFGALGDAGLTLPEKFDLKGILSIILQVIGLTYGHIRGLAVGIVGEEVVSHLEKSVEFFQVLIKEGPAGLWKWIVEKISELKASIMDQIKAFIQEKVIIAGIMWLIGLLNPVAAFIKACKAIYDIVKFFIERAEQVGELVSSIVDSIGAIAGGALGEAAGKVETALANAIPVAIGFLASLLGLGGISDKIKSIIHAIQEPIHNVITKVLDVVLKPFKWIGNKVKQGAAWAKKKLQQGTAFVKEKAKAGVAYVKGKLAGKQEKPAGTQVATTGSVKDVAIAEVHERAAGIHDFAQLDEVVGSVFDSHQTAGLKSLSARGSPEAGSMVVTAEASPEKKETVPVEIRVSQKEYERMLGGSAFVEHQLDPMLASVDAIGEAAADLAVNSRLGATKTKVWDDEIRGQIEARSADFMTHVRGGNWTSAGTLFHSIAKLYVQDLVGRSGGSLPGGAGHMAAEYTVRRGKGGSRLDLFIIDDKGEKHEIDWKTTGKSALTAETEQGEFSKHEWQSAQHKGPDATRDELSSQASRSWMDYVRTHLAGELNALNVKVRTIEAKVAAAAQLGKTARLTKEERQVLTIARAWADRGFFSKSEVDELFAKAPELKGPLPDQEPADLKQRLVLDAARANPGTIILRNLGDEPRLVANYGPGEWVKSQYVHRGPDGIYTVHYFENLTTGMRTEFKFTSLPR